jgi:peptide/nickel transport system substrate-binding protein
MRFQLRPGVRFHDGEPFDAEAVRFSIARYLNPKTGFPALGFISSLDKVEIIDEHTIDVVTKFPDGLLLNRLAGFILIVPPRYVAANGDGALTNHPVGTGPFQFARWERGRGITMTRNESYWNPDYPKVDRLEFRFIPAADQFQALKSGEIDVLTELPGTRTTEAMRTGYLKVIKAPSFYTVTGALNTNRPPLNDKRVRQALNYAISQEDLIRYDLLGNGNELATVTMAGEEGHNAALKPYPHDLKKARELLKEAGYPAGFTLKTLVKIQSERASKIIAEQLGRIGIKLESRSVADAEMIPTLNSVGWDLFISDCPDPMAHSYFIQSIFLSGTSPYSLGKNAAYDVMLQRMASTLDDDHRRALAEELDRYIYDEALLLFLYQRIKTYGVRSGVHFSPSITGMPYFFQVTKHGAP